MKEPGWALMCLLATASTVAAQAERKEIILGAAEMASTDQRADKPAAGKWWLRRDARGSLPHREDNETRGVD
jgi:hypothetical protein